jgi:hypothetical protein
MGIQINRLKQNAGLQHWKVSKSPNIAEAETPFLTVTFVTSPPPAATTVQSPPSSGLSQLQPQWKGYRLKAVQLPT